ncbi:MAG: apolipoprotein N-acyltransferase [Sedimentisphaerales bacterium]|nr:apolipoprotein N-acyltransferase [Sedimentisphaerales bacterium]
MKNKTYLLAAALFVASAVLQTVIQPPLQGAFLAWVAFVPFVLACGPQVKTRTLALTVYGAGFFYWLGNLYWIMPITILGWIILGLYMAVFWLLLALAVRFCRRKGVPLFLAFPVLLVGVERLFGFPLGGFYWRFLGHSQYASTTLIQVADLVGAAGVSFVLAMVNGLVADLVILGVSLRQRKNAASCQWLRPFLASPSASTACRGRPSARIALLGTAVTGVVVLGTVFYGRWRIRQGEQCIEQGPLVAALQSNVPQSIKRSFKASEVLFAELMARSRAAAEAGAELIAWPETMVQGILQPDLWPYLDNDLKQDKAFHQALSEHARSTANLLVGGYGAEVMRDFEGKLRLGNYNSAFFYRSDGTLDPQRYDKIHLVLFGEYIPFRQRFHWLYRQLRRFAPKEYNFDYSLEHGTKYTIFEMKPGASDPQSAIPNRRSPYRFGVIICYEDTVPYVARNFTLDEQGRKRVDWLVNISNDGWFVRFLDGSARVIPSTELPQHAAICAFRAVENRLPVLRSVNTGISCLIDSTGRIRSDYAAASDGFPARAMDRTGMAGWFADKMPIDTRVTFYSRHGQWLDAGCAIAFGAAVILPGGARLIRRRRRHAKEKDAR